MDARGAADELDRLSEALRGQVPASAIRGVTEAFSISVDKLDPTSREVAMLLALLPLRLAADHSPSPSVTIWVTIGHDNPEMLRNKVSIAQRRRRPVGVPAPLPLG